MFFFFFFRFRNRQSSNQKGARDPTWNGKQSAVLSVRFGLEPREGKFAVLLSRLISRAAAFSNWLCSSYPCPLFPWPLRKSLLLTDPINYGMCVTFLPVRHSKITCGTWPRLEVSVHPGSLTRELCSFSFMG